MKIYNLPIFFLGALISIFIFQESKVVALSNPASHHCVQKGGVLKMMEGPRGVRGVCVFSESRQCEEWAMFRGDCPVGGVEIKDFTTPAGIYCAIKGGQVLEGETKCYLPSGKICFSQHMYEGKCP